MRFETLSLEDWGHFQKARLLLPSGGLGLQVVYGANEAGKSTLLRAFGAALYGVDNRDREGDVERYRALSATASTGGGPLGWRRVKHPGRGTVDPALIQLAELTGSVDRTRWRRVFGFSDRDLAEGARTLTERPLAHALDPSVDPERARVRLDDAATALYGPKPQRKGRVLELGGDLDRVAVRRGDTRLSPAAWHAMNQAVADAEADQARCGLARDDADRRAGRLKRQCGARELLTRRDQLRAEAAAAPPAEGISPLAAATYRALAEKRLAQDRALRDAEGAVRTQAEAEAGIRVEEDVLALAGVVHGLARTLNRVRDTVGRLPLRQEQARTTEENLRRETTAFLPGIPLEEVTRRGPDARTLERIRELGRDRAAALATHTNGAAERERASLHLAEAQRQSDRTVVPPWDTTVAAALAAAAEPTRVEALDHLAVLREQRTADARRHRLELGGVPVSGDLAAVVSSLPPVTWIEDLGDERLRLRARADAARQGLSTARAQVVELAAAIAATDATRRLPSLADLHAAREQRDRSWIRIRRGLLEAGSIPRLEVVAVADQHEVVTSGADTVADTLREAAEAVAERARRVAELQIREGAVAAHAAESDAAEAALAAHEARWQAAWAERGVTPLDPASMARWTDRCREWARAEDERAAATVAHEAAATVVDAATAALRAALGACGLPTSGDRATLVARAKDAAHAHTSGLDRAQERQEALATARAEHTRVAAACAHAEAIYAQADGAWKAALAAAGAAPEDTDTERQNWPERVAAKVKEIRSWLEVRQSVERDTQAVATLRAEIRAALHPLGAVPPDSEFEVLDEVARRVATAEQAHIDLDKVRAVLRERETWRDQCRTGRDALVAELTAHRAGRTEADWLAHADAVARADEVRSALTAVERELAVHRAGDPPERFDAEAVATDAVTLQRLAEDAARDAADAHRAYDAANEALGRARSDRDRVRPDRTAADLAEEELALRTELRAGVAEWLTLRLARKLLDLAVVEREKDHLPLVVARAGRLFSDITGARYRGVEERDGKLVALLADGTALAPEVLSDATRQQVFLAARLAWAELHNRAHEPLPLVLDDVLSAFDEQRARVAMAALAAFAEDQQVVLLTHHAYVRDLAASLPGVHVTELAHPT